MKSRKGKRSRFTWLQRLVFGFLGVCVIGSGVATLLTGKLYFHNLPEHPLGWVFAPFAFVIGPLLILLAIRLGRPE